MIATTPAHAPLRLWPAVWRLLRLRLEIVFRSFRRARRGRKVILIVLWLVIAAAIGGVFYLSWKALDFLRSPDVEQILGELGGWVEAIPVLFISAAFIGIFLTSFGVLLQALYLSGDMDFLLSTPVPIRAVFISKLLQAILPNFTLICLFGLPVLFVAALEKVAASAAAAADQVAEGLALAVQVPEGVEDCALPGRVQK